MSAPLRIKEAIVVEGRYDKAAVAAVADTLILETAGFGVFKDGERLALLRRLAAVRGLIILTDSDGAGFVIRNHLKGAIPGGQLKHAYIPDVAGKERRKRAPGKEGKLGGEGVKPDVLRAALLRRLDLPEHMGAKALLAALNALYTRTELDGVLKEK